MGSDYRSLGLKFGDAVWAALALNEKRRLRELHQRADAASMSCTAAMFERPTDEEIAQRAADLGELLRVLGLQIESDP